MNREACPSGIRLARRMVTLTLVYISVVCVSGCMTDKPETVSVRAEMPEAGTRGVETLKAEYFAKNLCAAVHSICFDDAGYAYAGSLGDSPQAVGKRESKKVFRISPEGESEVFAELDCTWITALGIDGKGTLYAAAAAGGAGTTSIVGIDGDGKVDILAEGLDGVGSLSACPEGGLAIGTERGVYRISANKERAEPIMTGKNTLLDARGLNAFSYAGLGASIELSAVKQDGTFEAPKVIPVYRDIAKIADAGAGIVFTLNVPNGEPVKLFMIDTNAGTVRELNVDLSGLDQGSVINRGVRMGINNMAIRRTVSGDYEAYLTTWIGSILRVRISGD